MKYVLSFYFFGSFFFLLFFGGGIVDQVELFAVKNWEFGTTGLPTSFQDAKDDLISSFRGSIAEYRRTYR